MNNLTFLMRCPGCGAKNRVLLQRGKRVRIRCGSCGESLPINKRRVMLLICRQWIISFFTRGLPITLTALVDAFLKFSGAVLSPLKALWRKLPRALRTRLGWFLIGVLVLSYLVMEDSFKLSSLLVLALLLALAAVAIVFAAQGPSALRQMFSKVIRRCPSCGHRHFGWLKGCPRCGSGQ
jgi:hypothetical protein